MLSRRAYSGFCLGVIGSRAAHERALRGVRDPAAQGADKRFSQAAADAGVSGFLGHSAKSPQRDPSSLPQPGVPSRARPSCTYRSADPMPARNSASASRTPVTFSTINPPKIDRRTGGYLGRRAREIRSRGPGSRRNQNMIAALDSIFKASQTGIGSRKNRRLRRMARVRQARLAAKLAIAAPSSAICGINQKSRATLTVKPNAVVAMRGAVLCASWNAVST